MPVIVRQVAASLPVVLTERLAWVPVTIWPERVSLTPTLRLASAAAANLAPLRLGPLGRVPPLRLLPAEPTLHFSSRSFWASSRLLMSGLPWRARLAALVLLEVLADLPRFERASRRASTRARLGLCTAARLAVAARRSAPADPVEVRAGTEREGRLARLLRLLPAAAASSRSWHLHGALTVAAGAGVAWARSVRVRSLEESARLPRRERASRRASTRSRLGLATGRAALRRSGEGLPRAAAEGRPRDAVAKGVTGADAVGAAAGATVRAGWASAAVRTRPGAEL